ncbi:MAG: hypothetical protein IKD90_04825 [Clostridiales bacterium]|nr:hypothetical protein [Clostridiales bacterium]
MRIDSVERGAVWGAAVVGIIAQSVILAVFCPLLVGVFYFSVAMLTLNLSFFLEKTPANVFRALLVICALAAVVLSGKWYMGAIGLLLISAAVRLKPGLRRILGGILCLTALGCFLFREMPDVIRVLVVFGVLLASYILWESLEMIVYRLETMNQRLDRALTAAALDAMEQRSLREQIAKDQNVNEHNARLQERERISRDIHNMVGHTLSAATVTLDAASMLVPSDQTRAKEKIDVANSRVHEAISSVRSVVRTLDADDDKVVLTDYMKSLQVMVSEFMMDTEIKVYHNFAQIDQEARIPLSVASFLSSSLSELLTNGVKHGGAKIFVVTFLYDVKNVRLTVQDNGTGWGVLTASEKKMKLANGFGLRKMIEYAEKKGGSCVIESEDGFAVRLQMPLEE